jgi:hypothetical protein
MAEETSAGPSGRRETMRFMRWADVPGVEIFDREVEWARSVRARNRLVVHGRRGSQRERDMTVFDGRLCPDPVAQAVKVADEVARRQSCGPQRAFPGMEVLTFAEAFDTPFLVAADGSLSSFPADWFLHDEAACDLWLLACDQERRIEEPAVRPLPIVVAADTVWSSHRDQAVNDRRIAAFAEAALAPGDAGPCLAAGPAPGM